jgi:hypothetical protein
MRAEEKPAGHIHLAPRKRVAGLFSAFLQNGQEKSAGESKGFHV